MGQIKNIKLHIVTDIKISIPPSTMGEGNETVETKKPIFRELTAEDDDVPEITEIESLCMACEENGTTRLLLTKIPFFRDVIIMSFTCEACGYKSNEVKAGGAMEPHGMRINFTITDPTDMARDVLTSETCAISVPDFGLEVSHYSSSGRFTTVEGLLVFIKEQLGRTNPFGFGDSAEKEKTTKMKTLVEDLDSVMEGKKFVTIVLDDPVGNSYLQNTYAPDPDPNLIIEQYERTDEQDIELGIRDMKTEGYEKE